MNLVEKYNIPVPRYTSYPTVPSWNNELTNEQWKQHVKQTFDVSNDKDGISIYIHLPFCESLCTYCACNTRITVNHAVEEPYIKAVLKEWEMYCTVFGERPRIKEIHLGGGTPTFFNPINLGNLIKGILERGEVCADAEFSFEAHPSNTLPGHLISLYNLGFRRISYGIQDFDLKVQDAINRFQSFEEVQTVVDQARNVGYDSLNFDLVYGLPFQTLNTITGTIKKVLQLKPDRIAFYSYAHVPWIKPGQRKFTEKDLPLDKEKRELYEEGKKLFLENGYEEIGMDHFSLKSDSLYRASQNGRLHRNFMGYTSTYTRLLVGLGTSSISDSWTAFAQNIRTVEEYKETVEKGILPVIKGHILNTEDLILRKHILNIMCRFETDWSESNSRCETLYSVYERLKELAQDGLIELQPSYLKVTEKGKPFLRNICLCFDKYYWESFSNKNTFSTSI